MAFPCPLTTKMTLENIPLENETQERPRRAYLVGIQHPDEVLETASEMLHELMELAYTLGLEYAGSEIAKLREHNASTITGTGKTREIIAQAAANWADVIVLDDFLTPAQQRNW